MFSGTDIIQDRRANPLYGLSTAPATAVRPSHSGEQQHAREEEVRLSGQPRQRLGTHLDLKMQLDLVMHYQSKEGYIGTLVIASVGSCAKTHYRQNLSRASK